MSMDIGGGITNLVVPPLLEQESLMLIFVALGLGIVGMAFGRIKNKDSFQMHRWIMTGAVALNLIAISCGNASFTRVLLHQPRHEYVFILLNSSDRS